MGKTHPELSRGRTGVAAVACLALLTATFMGCGEPITTYQVSQRCIASTDTVLVLPLMDTRTFIDANDPHKDDLGVHARDIFVASMRENDVGRTVRLLAPPLPKQEKSMTNAEVAELGRQHGANVVVAGQIFSFTETRAASIPPRAGMFVRVVSASDGALLFVGDHYQSAAIPGAGGGRDLQARNVSDRLIEGICSRIPTTLAEVERLISSDRALASISGQRRVRIANNRAREGVRDPQPKPPPLIGFGSASTLNPDEWEPQEAPEVPPVLEFDEDFYNLVYQDSTAAVPLPPPPLEEIGVDTGEVTTTASVTESAGIPLPPEPPEADAGDAAATADAGTTDIPLPPEPPQSDRRPAVTVAVAMAEEVLESSPEPTVASVPVVEEPEVPAIVPEVTSESASARLVEPAAEEEAVVAAATYEPEPPAIDDEPAPVVADAEEEPAQPIALTAADGALPVAVSAEEVTAEATVETAPVVAESATGEAQYDYNAWIEQGYRHYFNREPEPETVTDEALVQTEIAPPVLNSVPTTPVETAVAPDLTSVPEPVPAVTAGRAVTMSGDELAADLFASEESLLIESVTFPRGRDSASTYEMVVEPNPEPVQETVTVVATEENGPVVSIPLAAEQPLAIRTVDLAMSQQPNLTAVGRMASTGAIRVLMLPYHDRDNPNNLIPNTGGGEVVTSLFGTQLAMDPDIQIMWDASGQTSHDRLMDRHEAIQLGRMVGADYVVRGEVVEFRRAQSVPSFYSAVISTAVLAAQMFFAEMSGVDVATEMYRVSDGACVMSRRDRAQQKYVVQAEKTVRRLATGMAEGVITAMKSDSPEIMDPLIDTISPLSLLTGSR